MMTAQRRKTNGLNKCKTRQSIKFNIQSWFSGMFFLTKIRVIKAMGFPVVTYKCESWTMKKVEHQGTYAFKLWC